MSPLALPVLRWFALSCLLLAAVFSAVLLARRLPRPHAVTGTDVGGRERRQQTLLLYLALCYACGVVICAVLPSGTVAAASCPFLANPLQLVPGRAVADVWVTAGATPLWRNPALLQILFNIVFFAPLGVLLRTLGRSLRVATRAGLGLSLLVEVTQLTGVWGLYPCPFRYADVDDLLVNTAGAVLGWLLAEGAVRLRARRAPSAATTPAQGR